MRNFSGVGCFENWAFCQKDYYSTAFISGAIKCSDNHVGSAFFTHLVGGFDPCVIAVMQQEMKIQPAIRNDLVELKARSYASITNEAA